MPIFVLQFSIIIAYIYCVEDFVLGVIGWHKAENQTCGKWGKYENDNVFSMNFVLRISMCHFWKEFLNVFDLIDLKIKLLLGFKSILTIKLSLVFVFLR